MTVEGAYNEQARGSIRPHISALYTDTFLDNRLGWSIAVDINKRSIDDQQFATDGVIQDSTWAGPDTRYRVFAVHQNDLEIGSATCRDRVCQIVYVLWVVDILKKKKKKNN